MTGISNTCRFRNIALEKIFDFVDVVNTSAKTSLWFRIAYHLFKYGLPVKLPDAVRANRKIKLLVDKNVYDVIWIDKGNTIEAETLKYIKKKQPGVKLISYSPDNMVLRHNYSRQYLEGISYYDAIVTNKSYIIDDLKLMGAKKVIFVNNTYEPSFHHPYTLTKDELSRFGVDIGFIGSWEKERCESILYLVKHGLRVTVWGDRQWKKYMNYSSFLTIYDKGLFTDEYCKALQSIKINLCFLRKINFDQQTTRSVEIPACGGFMLAERTSEHIQLFKEGEEADFFNSDEELLDKCKYYLTHEDERQKIAAAGRQRCLDSDYSNEGMIRKVLVEVISYKKSKAIII